MILCRSYGCFDGVANTSAPFILLLSYYGTITSSMGRQSEKTADRYSTQDGLLDISPRSQGCQIAKFLIPCCENSLLNIMYVHNGWAMINGKI